MIETAMTEAVVVPAAVPSAAPQRGYYDLPFLKRPLWGWEIALYFFLGGISAGAFVLSAAADLAGRKHHAKFVRNARYVSLVTLAPCPLLLIADLGRPAKFAHMLRVFKPQSPMNTGAWALFAYGPLAGAAGLLPSRAASVAALPFAFTMLAYPGVLLSTTSTPIWANTRLLGALLGMSSFSAACDTLALAAAADPEVGRSSRAALGAAGHISRTAEAGLLAAYAFDAGRTIAPITRGHYSRAFWAGVVGAGMIVPTLLRIGARKTESRTKSLFSSLFSLAGGLALKWIVVHSGRESASDPAANRSISRPAA
jgi:formate-dependent nitrite reductase membrane component NrfD